MKRHKLDDIERVTEAIYLREHQRIRGILAEEAELRTQLSQLSAQQLQNRTTPADGIGMQSLGADILWESWVERTRTDLNNRLAQTIARKLDVMEHVRTAFGRCEAVRRMQQNAAVEQRARRAAKLLTVLKLG